jgi:hypothetical protein
VDQDPLGAQGTTIFDNCPLVPLVDLQEQAALLRGSNRRPEGTPSPLQDSPVPACQQVGIAGVKRKQDGVGAMGAA